MKDNYHERVVRVFISSTFRDMYAEREELVKFTFPELRRRCRERGVEFVDVDLRWGVTEEQSERGDALPICLAEIERCQPYFIGLLGERYGWVPEIIDEGLFDTQPWLKEHRKKSVTELEILHGVLENKRIDQHSFFYFRDTVVSRKIETTLANETDYCPEPKSSNTRQVSLKERISQSHYSRKDYSNVKALGKLVLDDLWTTISKRFPESEIPSQLEQARLEHEAFAAVRRNVYIGRQEYFEQLDTHVNSDEQPLMILGESGSGKSALIANWIYQYKLKHPDDFVLLHFVGSTPDSTDYIQLLRRVILEIKAYLEPEQVEIKVASEKIISFDRGNESEVPSDSLSLIKAFPQWLAKIAAKGKFILILDGINQLEDKDNALDLAWLPAFIPPAIRLIVSTLPGRSLDALQKRNWKILSIELLDNKQGNTEDRRAFIIAYLERFSKTLNNSQIERITNSQRTTNPLYLKTLLDELRVFGSHEKLNERIEYYLQAMSINTLFEKMLERLEQDYERYNPSLTKDIMSLIWASRHGLSETELLDLLNIPQAIWSPLKLAVEELLVCRSGLFNFFHDFLRQAVQQRYLKDVSHQKVAHLHIADFFQSNNFEKRRNTEIPWQLQKAKEWNRLKIYLTHFDAFLMLCREDAVFDLVSYWQSLEGMFDVVEEYNVATKNYKTSSYVSNEEYQHILTSVASFLVLIAKYDAAENFYITSLKTNEGDHDYSNPVAFNIFSSLALLLIKKCNFEAAEKYFQKSMTISENLFGKKHPQTATIMNNLGTMLLKRGEYQAAMSLIKRSFIIFKEELGLYHANTTACLNNYALLLYESGANEIAGKMFRESLSVTEKILGLVHPDTATSLCNLASWLRDNGDEKESEVMIRRALKINETLLGENHPDTVFLKGILADYIEDFSESRKILEYVLENNDISLGAMHANNIVALRGLKLHKFADYDPVGIKKLYKREIEIYERVFGGRHPKMIPVLNDMAILLNDIGEYEEAAKYCEKELSLHEQYDIDKHQRLVCLNELVGYYIGANNYRSAEKICKDIVNKTELLFGKEHSAAVDGLNLLANILYNLGKINDSKKLQLDARCIHDKLLVNEYPDNINKLKSMVSQYTAMGDQEGAEIIYKDMFDINTAVYGELHLNSANSLFDIGNYYISCGYTNRAIPLFKQALGVCEKIGELSVNDKALKLFLMAICHNQIAFHSEVPKKDWDRAEYHYDKAVVLFKKAQQPIEVANTELNIQLMYQKSGHSVDQDRVKELTTILERVDDERAEKGRDLQKSI